MRGSLRSEAPAWVGTVDFDLHDNWRVESTGISIGEDGVVRGTMMYSAAVVGGAPRSCVIASYEQDGTEVSVVHLVRDNPVLEDQSALCAEATSDADGNVFLIGHLADELLGGEPMVSHLYVARVDPTGRLAWLHIVEEDFDAGLSHPPIAAGKAKIAFGHDGALYAAGYVDDFGPLRVMRFDLGR